MPGTSSRLTSETQDRTDIFKQILLIAPVSILFNFDIILYQYSIYNFWKFI